MLHDGRTMTERQLYLSALHLNPNFSYAYYNLATCLSRDESITLLDGRTLNKQQLLIEAVRCDPDVGDFYRILGAHLVSEEVALLHDGRTLGKVQLFLEALRRNPGDLKARNSLIDSLPLGQAWDRQHHSLVFGFIPVNALFATLLLGLQRLEAVGMLPPAHHSMLEDMLEGWTWGDTLELVRHIGIDLSLA